tara:strand:+ start:353 stop:532 length:180 start_codon:yes stop_codon:yes gene_type:complete
MLPSQIGIKKHFKIPLPLKRGDLILKKEQGLASQCKPSSMKRFERISSIVGKIAIGERQ